MSRYASRKFLLALLTLVSSNWVLYEKLITASDYKAILLGTVGVYIAGNVWQKATEKSVEKPTA